MFLEFFPKRTAIFHSVMRISARIGLSRGLDKSLLAQEKDQHEEEEEEEEHQRRRRRRRRHGLGGRSSIFAAKPTLNVYREGLVLTPSGDFSLPGKALTKEPSPVLS